MLGGTLDLQAGRQAGFKVTPRFIWGGTGGVYNICVNLSYSLIRSQSECNSYSQSSSSVSPEIRLMNLLF